MNRLAIPLLSVLLLSTSAPALAGPAPRTVPGLGEAESRLNLAAVQAQQTFVESERDGTTLRVGFVVVDEGGSTDVSPKATLYLTMFNESEMKDASSLHRVTDLNELVSAERKEAGVYRFVVRKYDLEGTLGGGPEATAELVVDARQASVDVRNMKGAEEFGHGWITTPVTVTESRVEAPAPPAGP